MNINIISSTLAPSSPLPYKNTSDSKRSISKTKKRDKKSNPTRRTDRSIKDKKKRLVEKTDT